MDGGQGISRIATTFGGTKALLAGCAAIIALLATASPSRADDVPPSARYAAGSPAMQIAQQIAVANWGTEACGGQVAIEWGTDDANINARSYWANPVSSYDAPAQNTQCRIVFNSGMAFTWPKFCTVFAHEYGHLTGHPHTVDGADVMSPIYRAPLPACVAADPSAVSPAPAPAAIAAAPTTAVIAPAVADPPARPSTTARRAKTRAHAKAAKAGARSSKVRARMAVARLAHFSDADAEPLPWEPFPPAEERSR